MASKGVRHDGIIKVIAGERFTPYTLARKLGAKVILESSSFQKGKERYSLLLVDEAFRVTQREDRVVIKKDGSSYSIKGKHQDILDVLRYFADQQPSIHQDLPIPAGGIGYLSYEFARFCDDIQFRMKRDPLDLPDAEFILGHVFVVFDHYTDIIYLVGMNYHEHEIDIEMRIHEIENELEDLNFNYLAQDTQPKSVEIVDAEDGKSDYLQGVGKIREEIIKGNLLQGVLSRRLLVKTDLSALEAYKNLRSTNPSPYLFYIDFGDYQLFGSSPEVHVKVKDGKAIMHPIAGTRRRGADSEEDNALEEELLADEKERAEHLMLVDLARNDLGRFCEAGSVSVDQFMGVERYSHVMHIVSRVSGSLRENQTGADAVRATFPAGTVSGAPKIQAIHTIDALEKEPRKFYAGLVGYMEPGGDLDTCITIRSALKRGEILALQAGAGIVYDSTAEREYEETGEKLKALAVSVGLEL
jgi:anthranilate synthase component I